MLKKLFLLGLLCLPSVAEAKVINLPYTDLKTNGEALALTGDKNDEMKDVYMDVTQRQNDKDIIYQIVKNRKILPKPIKSHFRYSDLFEMSFYPPELDINLDDNDTLSKYINFIYKFNGNDFVILLKNKNNTYENIWIYNEYSHYLDLINRDSKSSVFFYFPDDFDENIKKNNIYKIGDFYIINWASLKDILNNDDSKATYKAIDDLIAKESAK